MHIYYDDEQGEYVHADEYLSGDIRGKIEHLEGMIASLQGELRSYASEKVLPEEIQSARIMIPSRIAPTAPCSVLGMVGSTVS